jgi:hypothetical protein
VTVAHAARPPDADGPGAGHMSAGQWYGLGGIVLVRVIDWYTSLP